MGITTSIPHMDTTGPLDSAGPSALAVIALVLTLYALAASVGTWRRLRHIPGPTGAAWSRWWLLRNTLGGEMYLALERVCEQYGESICQ